jgi:hypothetical protein
VNCAIAIHSGILIIGVDLKLEAICWLSSV